MRTLRARIVRSSAWVSHAGTHSLTAHATFVAYHPLRTLALVGIITIIAALGLLRLTVRNNYEADLPADDPIVQANSASEDIAGKEDKVIVCLIADDGDLFTPARLEILQAIETAMRRTLPGFKRLTSPGTTPTLQGHFEEIDGVREWILDSTPLLATIPETEEAWAELRQRCSADPNFYGKFIAKDYTGIACVAEVERSYDFQKPINAWAAELKRAYSGSGVRILVTGDPILNHETDTGIERQVQIFFAVALVVCLMITWYAFRSVRRGILFPLLTITLANLWVMGVIGWSGRPLNVVTSVIPVLITSITVSYGIRLTKAWEERRRTSGQSREADLRDAIIAAGGDLCTVAATASFGSATLSTFPLSSIREFGIFSAIGCVGALGATLTLFAVCLVLAGGKVRPETMAEQRASEEWYRTLGQTIIARPYVIVGCALVILLLAIAGIARLRVGVSWREFFPAHHDVITTADAMNRAFNGSYYMNVVVETPEQDGVLHPSILETMDAMLTAAQERFPHIIGNTHTLGGVLRQTNAMLHEADDAYRRMPETKDAVGELLFVSSMATSPGYFSGLIDHERRMTRGIVFLRVHDIGLVEEAYRFMDTWAKEHFPASVRVTFGGPAMLWVAQTRHVVEGKIWNIIWSMVTVWMFGIIIFRSFLFGTLAVIPLAFATTVTFGLMGWLGIRLNMATAIVTSMAVAFGVDPAFLFVHCAMSLVPDGCNPLTHRVVTALQRSGRTIAVDTKANASGFTTFLASAFSPVRNLGWLIAFNITVSALASVTLVPALYTILRGRREEAAFLRAENH